MSKISLCKYISFPTIEMNSGKLIAAGFETEIPFPMRRIYYLIGVGADEKRGNHANIKNQQLMVAIQGSFQVTVDDGEQQQVFTLDKNNEGLYLPEKIWRSVHSFSHDAICIVFCSEVYDSSDYIKDYEEFLRLK
ncbi:FdtA/QdtA family cupin domain-containing protein [Belliella sp. DSM 107340]|uniref:FdtA/QdtA family cupin domain-containing protein n=1 Tax=Belliella calami TaxID=2923436 RepID=A0ABS9UIY1_9BACT|nr:FdtA/QdtA family cupin domain-containing protein [Belliella calami]MCH7396522.1 FdtA/QdtA family cupin domain-containing protein [Belliella calami]